MTYEVYYDDRFHGRSQRSFTKLDGVKWFIASYDPDGEILIEVREITVDGNTVSERILTVDEIWGRKPVVEESNWTEDGF